MAINSVIIVGTGMGALAVYRSIVEQVPEASVTFLEIGGVRHDESLLFCNSETLRRDFRKQFKLWPPFSVSFGGTANLWHGVLGYHDASDFNSDSPYDDYVDYLNCVDSVLSRDVKLSMSDLRVRLSGEGFTQRLLEKELLVLKKPWRSKREIHDQRIVYGELCDIEEFDGKVRLRLADSRILVADKVVLSAGSVGTARLVSKSRVVLPVPGTGKSSPAVLPEAKPRGFVISLRDIPCPRRILSISSEETPSTIALRSRLLSF